MKLWKQLFKHQAWMDEVRALLWLLFNWPSSRKMSRPRKMSLLNILVKFDEGILCFDKLKADFSKVYNVLSLNIVLAPNFTQRKLRRVFFSSFLLFSASSCSCLLCSVHLINVWFSFTFKDALYFDRVKMFFVCLNIFFETLPDQKYYRKIGFSFYLVNNFCFVCHLLHNRQQGFLSSAKSSLQFVISFTQTRFLDQHFYSKKPDFATTWVW